MSNTLASTRTSIGHGWLWITLAVLLSYWPLTTAQYGLSEGDTLDCWLPWRHFMASALKNGELPAWNPLQQMGYPIHADLQGPAWYPEALALGGTVGMGPLVLQLLFLFYLIVAGCGMRVFVNRLVQHDGAALITGMAYALSGFFTAHAMHFYAVISAAWIPWLLWALLRLLDEPVRRNALIAAVFLFLLLTGGNHTFLIILVYPAIALVAFSCWRYWQRGDRAHVRAILVQGSLAVGAALIMACGTLHALFEVSPYISRVQGLDLVSAQRAPFTLAALKSLLWPAAAAADADALGTDITMGNGYFGSLMLLFAIVGLRLIRGHAMRIFSVFAAIAALAAFGPLLPVHGLLWRFVPGMDLFRFPSYFWFFVILFMLPVSGLGLAAMLRKEGGRAPLIIAVIFLGFTLVMLLRNSWTGWGPADAPLIEQMRGTPIGSLMMLGGAALIVFLLLFAIWWRSSRRNWALLAVLVGVEMLVAIQFTQWNTTLGPHAPAELAERIEALPVGPIVPRMRPMGKNTDDSQVMHLLWRNTQNFQGQPSHGGFNSFWMAAHERLTDHHARLHAAMLEQPFVYFADTLIQSADSDGALAGAHVRFQEEPAGTPIGWIEASLRPVSFTFDRFILESRAAREGFLVVQQNNYPGWKVFVDEKEVPVLPVNVAAFGAWVPAGEHRVEVRYHKPVLNWLLAISYLTFFGIMLWLAWTSARPLPFVLSVLALLLLWVFSVFFNIPKSRRMADGWYAVNKGLPDHARYPMLLNADRPLPEDRFGARSMRMDEPDDMAPLADASVSFPALPDTLVLAWYGLPINAASRAFLADRGYALLDRYGNKSAGAWLLARVREREPGWKLLHHDPLDGGLLLHGRHSPWTPAWRRNIGELLHEADGKLIIDLKYSGAGATSARLVLERRRNEQITDHETIPLTGLVLDPQEEHVFQAVRSLPHKRFAGEELGIYVLSTGEDTVHVKDLRIRSGALPF